MALLRKNLAKKTNNFEDIDKEHAFIIWYTEKEFNVGPITEDYLWLKILNLFDEHNIKKYNKIQEQSNKSYKTMR